MERVISRHVPARADNIVDVLDVALLRRDVFDLSVQLVGEGNGKGSFPRSRGTTEQPSAFVWRFQKLAEDTLRFVPE